MCADRGSTNDLWLCLETAILHAKRGETVAIVPSPEPAVLTHSIRYGHGLPDDMPTRTEIALREERTGGWVDVIVIHLPYTIEQLKKRI